MIVPARTVLLLEGRIRALEREVTACRNHAAKLADENASLRKRVRELENV